MRRLLPILGWLPHYDRRWLRGDVAAGIAVTALIVPKNLGYAGIAGVPLQNGLYAAAAGASIYALFCTSRQISTGPSSSLAAVAGGAVLVDQPRRRRGGAARRGDHARRPGVLFLLLAAFRLGWIAQFLSKAVVTGFLAGAAVDVVIGELPKLTGTSADGDNAWQELGVLAPQRSTTSTGRRSLVGAVALAVHPRAAVHRSRGPGGARARRRRAGRLVRCSISAPRRRTRRRRAARPSVAGPARAPASVGDHAPAIVIAAFALLLIGFSQTAGDARAFATRHQLPHRRRPGIDRAGDGEPRRRRLPGHAGVDQPVGELAERVGRRADARSPRSSPARSCSPTLLVLAPLFSDRCRRRCSARSSSTPSCSE